MLPQLGSRLYTLPKEKRSNLNAAALSFVSEALNDERDITVESVTAEPDGDTVKVTVYISSGGEQSLLELTV